MFLRKTIAVLASAAALSVGVAGTAQAAPKVLTYNSTGAAKYDKEIDAGAAVWNANVKNVQLKKITTGRANFTIVADPGWPRAQTTTLGNGKIWMGKRAVDDGHDVTRIAAHEIGHILGLPDIKPGPCTSLMSGSTAGTSCKNPVPNAAEKAEVESNFRRAVTVEATTFVDAA